MVILVVLYGEFYCVKMLTFAPVLRDKVQWATLKVKLNNFKKLWRKKLIDLL